MRVTGFLLKCYFVTKIGRRITYGLLSGGLLRNVRTRTHSKIRTRSSVLLHHGMISGIVLVAIDVPTLVPFRDTINKKISYQRCRIAQKI